MATVIMHELTAGPIRPRFGSIAAPETEWPILLLPVRIETRFRGSGLLASVLADQIVIDMYEPRLAWRELESGNAFRAERAKGNGRDAWRGLAQRFGPECVAWVASTVEELRDYGPPEVWPDDTPLLIAPRLLALPDRFVVYLYRSEYRARHPVAGRPIAHPLTMLCDPAAENRSLFDDASDWIVSFSRAEEVGMGIPLSATTGDAGFRRGDRAAQGIGAWPSRVRVCPGTARRLRCLCPASRAGNGGPLRYCGAGLDPPDFASLPCNRAAPELACSWSLGLRQPAKVSAPS